MSTPLFTSVDGFSQRDRDIAELVTRLALHTDVDPSLASRVGQHPALKDEIARFERELSQQSPTLSNLLASTTQSKCCS